MATPQAPTGIFSMGCGADDQDPCVGGNLSLLVNDMGFEIHV
jgi:hypothetical protein